MHPYRRYDQEGGDRSGLSGNNQAIHRVGGAILTVIGKCDTSLSEIELDMSVHPLMGAKVF